MKPFVSGPVQRVGVFKSSSRWASFSGSELIPPVAGHSRAGRELILPAGWRRGRSVWPRFVLEQAEAFASLARVFPARTQRRSIIVKEASNRNITASRMPSPIRLSLAERVTGFATFNLRLEHGGRPVCFTMAAAYLPETDSGAVAWTRSGRP